MSSWSLYNPPPRSLNSNTLQGNDISFNGLFYAFPASGGYLMEQGIKSVTMLPFNQINQYDVTNTLQISFDVRKINEKMGLFKDANNIEIISTTYEPLTNSYPSDNIFISANEFVSAVNISNIISVGAYRTLYQDFITYVNIF